MRLVGAGGAISEQKKADYLDNVDIYIVMNVYLISGSYDRTIKLWTNLSSLNEM